MEITIEKPWDKHEKYVNKTWKNDKKWNKMTHSAIPCLSAEALEAFHLLLLAGLVLRGFGQRQRRRKGPGCQALALAAAVHRGTNIRVRVHDLGGNRSYINMVSINDIYNLNIYIYIWCLLFFTRNVHTYIYIYGYLMVYVQHMLENTFNPWVQSILWRIASGWCDLEWSYSDSYPLHQIQAVSWINLPTLSWSWMCTGSKLFVAF